VQRHRPWPHQAGHGRHQLGTSDTYFGSMKHCQTDANGEGHVFGSPTGDYMTLICFKKRIAGPRKNPRRLWHQGLEEIWRGTHGDEAGRQRRHSAAVVRCGNCSARDKPGIHRFDLDAKDAAPTAAPSSRGR